MLGEDKGNRRNRRYVYLRIYENITSWHFIAKTMMKRCTMLTATYHAMKYYHIPYNEITTYHAMKKIKYYLQGNPCFTPPPPPPSVPPSASSSVFLPDGGAPSSDLLRCSHLEGNISGTWNNETSCPSKSSF